MKLYRQANKYINKSNNLYYQMAMGCLAITAQCSLQGFQLKLCMYFLSQHLCHMFNADKHFRFIYTGKCFPEL